MQHDVYRKTLQAAIYKVILNLQIDMIILPHTCISMQLKKATKKEAETVYVPAC